MVILWGLVILFKSLNKLIPNHFYSLRQAKSMVIIGVVDNVFKRYGILDIFVAKSAERANKSPGFNCPDFEHPIKYFNIISF